MIVGYARVSSNEQNLDRQLDMLSASGLNIEKVFTEKTSGKNINDREIFQQCMEFVRDGDHLVMTSIDRCARSLIDLMKIVSALEKKGVIVEFLKEKLKFEKGNTDPMQTMMLQLLGSFAEFERSLIRERQSAGIKSALARGVSFGRKYKLTLAQCREIRSRKGTGESVIAIAKDLDVTRQTIYKALKRCIVDSGVMVSSEVVQ